MDTINNIELRDESVYPDETVLKDALGQSYEAYIDLLSLLQRVQLNYEWRYYKDGKAWLCKAQKKSETIVWMSARKGYMQATVYFPLKSLDAVLALDVSDHTKEKIVNTKNVGKSKPCIFEIRSKEMLVDFEKVMKLKIASK